MNKSTLKGKVIAFTGSTGGLGLASARALQAKGAKLALMDMDPTALERQVIELGGPDHAMGFQIDVCSMESVKQAMQDAVNYFGKIDVVVAGAGIGAPTSFEHMAPEIFERTVDINLNGVFRTFQAALPFVKQTNGYLLAISSMAAFVHSPLNAQYTASKAGVWAMCDSLRVEMQHAGVGVGTFHPTFFETPMMANVEGQPCSELVWKGHTGIWKFAELDDVVSALVDCVEKRRDMVTVPSSNALVANAPGLVRKFIERIGFNRQKVAQAVQLMAEQN